MQAPPSDWKPGDPIGYIRPTLRSSSCRATEASGTTPWCPIHWTCRKGLDWSCTA